MGEIIKLDNICQYNEMVGQETLHPLVSVLDLSKSSRMMKHVRMSYGFYAVFLKEVKCGDSTITIIKKERWFFWLPDR